jgi:hypothetical protein
LVGEEYLEALEARSGDPMNKCLQVGANSAEREKVKVGECDGCCDRHLHEFPLRLKIGTSEAKDSKHLQLRHA